MKHTFIFSDFSMVLLRSSASLLTSASEFLSSSLHALRLATAEAVRDRDVDLLRAFILLGELDLENLEENLKNKNLQTPEPHDMNNLLFGRDQCLGYVMLCILLEYRTALIVAKTPEQNVLL